MEIAEIRQSLLGKPTRRLELELLEEDYRQMLAVFAERGLEERAGLLTALALGVAELRRQGEQPSEDDLVKQLNRLESAYVAMKHKAFLLARDNERMELARSGWEVELAALRKLLAELKGEAAPPAVREAPAGEEPARPPDWELEAPAFLEEEPRSAAEGSKRSLWRRLTGR
ncbi:MAG: hypothetical protein K6U89_09865 [Chloroflexi bacterium]|nr:hypothetical protein [Chloroflexota bacterium]